jgi:hypothetical protein
MKLLIERLQIMDAQGRRDGKLSVAATGECQTKNREAFLSTETRVGGRSDGARTGILRNVSR